jgi:hypothetical protein
MRGSLNRSVKHRSRAGTLLLEPVVNRREAGTFTRRSHWFGMARSSDMGELLDALNGLDERATAPDKPADSFVDVAAQIFRAASRTVNEAIEVLQEPNMPLDMISRWTRRAPLAALGIAFLVGVRVARRRRS